MKTAQLALILQLQAFLTYIGDGGTDGNSGYWVDWWTYEGISGPDYWSINREWRLCTKGKHQSPINIESRSLLFDPNLKDLIVDSVDVKGILTNTGHDVTIEIQDRSGRFASVNVTSGPLSYRYTVSQIKLHFGSNNNIGSEHAINKKKFSAELQIYAFNSELYRNLTEASKEAQGLIALSVFLQIAKEATKEVDVILKDVHKILYKGSSQTIHRLSIKNLLPNTRGYITYEGSLTQPSCYETVTWIIMNRPIYISQRQIDTLRTLYTDSKNSASEILLMDNYRPISALNHRAVRTNINFPQNKHRSCTMQRDLKYKLNMLFVRQ